RRGGRRPAPLAGAVARGRADTLTACAARRLTPRRAGFLPLPHVLHSAWPPSLSPRLPCFADARTPGFGRDVGY
ncbi:hypothetical protein AB0L10_43375, partial [Streptomyces flaveolus]|uniref:hypothetical protein n=1 Tax=Streptomyces flaveolus TaxID=67297 RepID=UPI00342E86BC